MKTDFLEHGKKQLNEMILDKEINRKQNKAKV